MSEYSLTSESTASLPVFDRLCRKLFLNKLAQIDYGSIRIIDEVSTFETVGNKRHDLAATVEIKNIRTYRLLVMRGALGGAEAYMAGWWEADNLFAFIRLMALNQKALAGLEGGLAVMQRPLESVLYYLSRNTMDGSLKNISAHYDLSNELFKTFLDEKMMYSCAYYPENVTDLDQAATAKLKLICDKMDLQPNDKILEIGTGWGGFAIYAAENYGCHVTTTTISKEQHDYAADEIKKKGLEGKITLLFEDYRKLEGKYDKVVSIEMIEAVGAQFLNEYISKCADLLKEDGALFLQAITINDQIYDRALKEVDFIKKYIFPGSFIPSSFAIQEAAKTASDLRMYDFEDLTPHYTKTLLSWRDRFMANKNAIKKLGFDDVFIKKWDYYFCYCAGGFAERSIGSVHMIFGKPLYRNSFGRAQQIKENS